MSDREKLIAILQADWKQEQEGARTYRLLASRERDASRREILLRLATAEEEHARRWEAKLAELGAAPQPYREPMAVRLRRLFLGLAGTDTAVRHIAADEARDAARYARESVTEGDAATMLREVQREERVHGRVLRELATEHGPRTALDVLLKRERWHVTGGSWIGDAIYGVNDGLGATFGIVSGMAGYSGGSHVVLVAGLAAMLASALSMGSGAYLAAKSEREVYEAELSRERQEIEETPEEEMEELALFYQLKGFTAEEAGTMAQRLAQQPEQMLHTLAHEELGLSQSQFPNPLGSALSATLSTAVGAAVPVLPFLFAVGWPAVIASAIISTVAHFLVGAIKSIFTTRNWFASGMEMTIVGVAEAGVTYLIGLWLGAAG